VENPKGRGVVLAALENRWKKRRREFTLVTSDDSSVAIGTGPKSGFVIDAVF